MLLSNTSIPATNAILARAAVVCSLVTVCHVILRLDRSSCLSVHTNFASDITNLTVTLSEADTSFANVMSLGSVTDSTFKSTDGGITWNTDRITVSSINFDSSSDTVVD
jgi:ADP-glucose pyrophosphorylase